MDGNYGLTFLIYDLIVLESGSDQFSAISTSMYGESEDLYAKHDDLWCLSGEHRALNTRKK